MTDDQARLGKLEDKYHDVDKRQESFEIYTKQRQDSFEDFVRAYIDSNERHIVELKAERQEMREELKSMGKHVQNLATAAMVGIGAISVSVAIFVASAVTR